MVREHKATIHELRKKLAAKAKTTATAAAVAPLAVTAAAPTTVTPAVPLNTNSANATTPPPFNQHSFIEQQTALHLAQLAQTNSDLGLNSNKVTNLIGALIAEAPETVVSLYAGKPIDTSNSKGKGKAATPEADPEEKPAKQDNSLPEDERRFLEALQELIRRKLNGTGSSGGA